MKRNLLLCGGAINPMALVGSAPGRKVATVGEAPEPLINSEGDDLNAPKLPPMNWPKNELNRAARRAMKKR